MEVTMLNRWDRFRMALADGALIALVTASDVLANWITHMERKGRVQAAKAARTAVDEFVGELCCREGIVLEG